MVIEPRPALTTEQLDQITGREIANAHVNGIYQRNDAGEIELLLMFFHLLHARRHVLDVDALATRRAEFDEHMDRVFAETGA